jgi:hypothetical protein
LLLQQFFIQNDISYQKTELWPTRPHNYTEDSGICDSVLSMIVCHQYRTLDFADRNIVRRLLALPHRFAMGDHQDASSVGGKDKKTLIARSGLYCVCSRHSHPNFCDKAAFAGLCGVFFVQT